GGGALRRDVADGAEPGELRQLRDNANVRSPDRPGADHRTLPLSAHLSDSLAFLTVSLPLQVCLDGVGYADDLRLAQRREHREAEYPFYVIFCFWQRLRRPKQLGDRGLEVIGNGVMHAGLDP